MKILKACNDCVLTNFQLAEVSNAQLSCPAILFITSENWNNIELNEDNNTTHNYFTISKASCLQICSSECVVPSNFLLEMKDGMEWNENSNVAVKAVNVTITIPDITPAIENSI